MVVALVLASTVFLDLGASIWKDYKYYMMVDEEIIREKIKQDKENGEVCVSKLDDYLL
jgi:hypothetical protein